MNSEGRLVLDLMRRYAYAFVNSHDPDIARQIMDPGYRLNMGGDTLIGRDDAYIPAVLHQFSQFPALGFTIHELITDGRMTALMFTEHGRSARRPDAGAAWRGVSIYRAVDGVLAECWVEQDHLGRRHQLATGVADPVGPVALDPWTGHEPVTDAQRDAGRAALERWTGSLTTWPPDGALVDAGSAAGFQPAVDVTDVAVNAFVVEGSRIALNVTVAGSYRGGWPDIEAEGAPVELNVGAFARLVQDGVADIEAVSNRVAVQRQLRGVARETYAAD